MDSYFEWLLRIIDCPDCYRKLMEKLDSRQFTWTIRMDENRAEDGLALRDKFLDEYGYTPDQSDIFIRPCSVLEMMVALACRIDDDIMFDPAYGDRAPEWFWIMITNLGLDGMDNDNFNNQNVDEILNVFLARTYMMNGTGGLFPLKHPNFNQRRVEIWYQMSSFLGENFNSEG